jgi:hypothetical protein
MNRFGDGSEPHSVRRTKWQNVVKKLQKQLQSAVVARKQLSLLQSVVVVRRLRLLQSVVVVRRLSKKVFLENPAGDGGVFLFLFF